MSITAEQIEAGQAVYTPKTLRIYDNLVLGFSSRWLWKCTAEHLLAHYQRNLSANHLDVGVGTGYFLDHCTFPDVKPRVALMDLNQHALDFTDQRIARYEPEIYLRNILEPLNFTAEKFDSIALNYVLHCLPGTMESKSIVFAHLKSLMQPNAVLFGSTILHNGVPRNWLARRLMAVYNKKGIFTNTHDDAASLERALKQHFTQVEIKIEGCVALFSARN